MFMCLLFLHNGSNDIFIQVLLTHLSSFSLAKPNVYSVFFSQRLDCFSPLFILHVQTLLLSSHTGMCKIKLQSFLLAPGQLFGGSLTVEGFCERAKQYSSCCKALHWPIKNMQGYIPSRLLCNVNASALFSTLELLVALC